MNKKDVFIKFIKLNSCSYEEYEEAKNYLNEATILEKKAFLNSVFMIVKKVFKMMINKETSDFRVGHKIYSKYGLSTHEFEFYFNLFMKDASKTILDIYEILKEIDNKKAAKDIFERAKQLEWKDLKTVAVSFNISIAKVKYYIDYYAFNILKFDKNKFSKYKKAYKAYTAFINSHNQDFMLALEYYEKFSNEEEKIIFEKYVNKIITNVTELLNNREDLNDYLNTLGLNVCNLFSLVLKFNNDLIYSISLLYEDFYRYSESVRWNKTKMIEEAKNIGMTYDDYFYLAKMYASYILNIEKIDDVVINKRCVDESFNYPFVKVLFQILEETDENIIHKLFQESGINKDHIVRFCYSKSRSFPKEIQKQYEKNLLDKYAIFKKVNNGGYIPYKNLSQEIIMSFLKSDLDIKEFCRANNLHSGHFKHTLLNIEDASLLQKIKEKIELQENEAKMAQKLEKEEYISFLKSRVHLFISFIRNGIIINDIYKDFDLIDFFMFFKDINPNKIVYSFLEDEDKIILKKFLAPFIYSTHISRESLINGHIEIGCCIDDNGKLIKNTGRVITKEEITNIISFMDENEIPITDCLFDIALKRYINNSLDIYKTSKLTLK